MNEEYLEENHHAQDIDYDAELIKALTEMGLSLSKIGKSGRTLELYVDALEEPVVVEDLTKTPPKAAAKMIEAAIWRKEHAQNDN